MYTADLNTAHCESMLLHTLDLRGMWETHKTCNSLQVNTLNAELNPICHLLALGAHHILHVGSTSVNAVAVDKG
jgi:hypothetical protein